MATAPPRIHPSNEHAHLIVHVGTECGSPVEKQFAHSLEELQKICGKNAAFIEVGHLFDYNVDLDGNNSSRNSVNNIVSLLNGGIEIAVKLLRDLVIFESWSCGVHPVVWVHVYDENYVDVALEMIERLRKEFSADALDIVVYTWRMIPKLKAQMELRFVMCTNMDAVKIVMTHICDFSSYSRPWFTLERPRPYQNEGPEHVTNNIRVPTLNFYDKDKPL
ncbi:hypothetical protein BGZ94_005545 [Podila epigama]|nr:hypothetical protein BGZ94_005545 [Podila epigama]